MNLQTKIIEPHGDLKRCVMVFWLWEDRISLRSYSVEERQTKRHAWRHTAFWSSRSGDGSTLTARPEIPQATKDKAVELIRNQIKYRLE